MFRRIWTSTLLLGVTLLLSACGGGSGGGAPATGDVTVVLTDGPTDRYERILVTMTGMTLIGSGGQVALYDGEPVTFDLLEMSDWADLAFNTKVLAGTYSKIRIQISEITAIDLDDENATETIRNLPANGKIDLNPRGTFEVSPDWTTVIKLDIDAKRSFQVVETGNGKLKFRPIVFVDIFQGDIFLPDRLVRLFGTVDAGSIVGADTTTVSSDDSFRLCDLDFISQVSGAYVGDPDACVRVHADTSPSFFDDAGAEVDFSAVSEGSVLTAVGFLAESDDAEAVLGLDAVVVALGDRQPDNPAGWSTMQGLVASDPSTSPTCVAPDSCFPFDSDEAGLVDARMQPGTRVFRADGAELSQSDVNEGDTGSMDALPVGGEQYAALIVLANDVDSGAVSGSLDSVGSADGYVVLDVITDDSGGMAGVCVDSDTNVVQVLVDNDAVTIFDLLDPGVLEQGILVEAYGDPVTSPAECDIVADMVILETPPAMP